LDQHLADFEHKHMSHHMRTTSKRKNSEITRSYDSLVTAVFGQSLNNLDVSHLVRRQEQTLDLRRHLNQNQPIYRLLARHPVLFG
jgi:AICAR transformylase/IMP cyclohydrolase PurH